MNFMDAGIYQMYSSVRCGRALCVVMVDAISQWAGIAAMLIHAAKRIIVGANE